MKNVMPIFLPSARRRDRFDDAEEIVDGSTSSRRPEKAKRAVATRTQSQRRHKAAGIAEEWRRKTSHDRADRRGTTEISRRLREARASPFLRRGAKSTEVRLRRAATSVDGPRSGRAAVNHGARRAHRRLARESGAQYRRAALDCCCRRGGAADEVGPRAQKEMAASGKEREGSCATQLDEQHGRSRRQEKGVSVDRADYGIVDGRGGVNCAE